MSDEQVAIQFAKRFAEKGFYVFPMYSSAKGPQKPFGWARNEVKEEVDRNKIVRATTDVNEIDAWPEKIRSAYNGAKVVSYGVLGIGCIIFDLDNKDGKNGSAEFKKLMTKHKIPSPHLVVKSKSGGFHLYYARPEKFKNTRVKTMASVSIGGVKYDGVDVRGDGGMVVGPMVECNEDSWTSGTYALVKGQPGDKLSEMPSEIVVALGATSFSDPLENLAASSSEGESDEVMDVLKRGEIPKVLPRGARNHGFYVYINGLRNKGFGPQTVRAYVEKLIEVTEGKEDLRESVDIEDMIARIYEVDLNNPFDVARDLIARGLYRVTGHGNKLKYVCYNENPYFSSANFHDITSLKQLLGRYTRNVPQANGKEKSVNPADLIDKTIGQDKEVDTIGFKPGAEAVFTSSEMGGRRFLNTWRDPRMLIKNSDIDDDAYDQFLFIVSRIFGAEGSDEYQFGLDLPAWVLQKPGNKPVVVPFVQSAHRGVGKSCYINALRHVMETSLDGNYQARSVRLEEIGARFFNPNGASILMLDEVQFPTHRNMRQEATSFWKHLKTLITAPVISVEIKGGATFEVPCQSAMIMAGNNNNHFPIEEADRRIWIIDNNAPILAKGLADKLFDLDKPDVSSAVKQRTANSIRYWLNKHNIKLNLSEMRAPMNDLKREMYLTGLTDLEEWFITHFEDPEKLAAKSALVTKEMIVYALETSEQMIKSRWRENPEDAFRELRKRGMVNSVKAKGSPTLTRQVTNYPNVNSNGMEIVSKDKGVIYTSRQHGEFNNVDNEFIKQALRSNIASINSWRQASIQSRGKNLIA